MRLKEGVFVSSYRFRQATAADLSLLIEWQSQAHVRAWWDGPEPATTQEFEDTRVSRWIVTYRGQPFAYMQDYTVHGWPDHHFGYLPNGARGIDQFIGVADMLGCGHGPTFIKQRLGVMFAAGVPVVATDPHPDNHVAIRAYHKAGFHASGPAQDTPWGKVLPMTTKAPTPC